MKNNLSLLMLFFFFPIFLLAQNSRLLKDASVEWIGESTFEYFLEESNYVDFEKMIDRPSLMGYKVVVDGMKMDPEVACEKPLSSFFTLSMIENVMEGKRKVFDLKDNRVLTIEEIDRLFTAQSTVTTFDPATSKTEMILVSNRIFSKIESFKIKQHWYLKKGDKQLNINVVGIIPVYHERDDVTGKVTRKELFYLPVEGSYLGDVFNLNNAKTPWVKRSIDYLPVNSIKTLKGNSKTLMDVLWENPKKGISKIYPFESNSICGKEANKDYFLNNVLGSVDTVITFDPVTYQEKITVTKNEALTKGDIKGYRTVQYWCFDPKTNTLQSYLKRMAPFFLEDNGITKYYKPIYYLKFD